MKRKVLDWLGIEMPIISEDEAIKIAREECARRNWTWIEPVKVSLGMRAWTVRTNAPGLGAIAIIKVHKRKGDVISASYVGR